LIARIKGTLSTVLEDRALVDIGGLTYEVMITRAVGDRLIKTGKVGNEIEFRTMHYIEGAVGMSNLVPRLVGFLNESDLEFFTMMITVQGLSVKRSLKALALPVKDVARAIELSDTATLKKLPEIGPKLAQKIILELKGKAAKFALLKEEDIPESAYHLSAQEEYQQEALDVLLQLQYSPTEAESLVARYSAEHPEISSSEELIQEIFRSQTKL